MSEYNMEQNSKDFDKGKFLLDSGQYREAIKLYKTVIARIAKYKEMPDELARLQSSYNNLGVALCKLGLTLRDKVMYLEGMEDLRKSVALEESEKVYPLLIAYKNLKISESEIEEFDKPEKLQNNIFRLM